MTTGFNNEPKPNQNTYAYDEKHPYKIGERWGASVLNDSEHLTEQAQRLKAAADAGHVTVEPLAWGAYEVEPPLRAFTVILTDRLHHTDEDGRPGEFEGWFVGEEYHGGTHPLLLLAPERVLPHDTTQTVDEITVV